MERVRFRYSRCSGLWPHIAKAILEAPAGNLNIHTSLLPRWRGAAPIQRAILAGDTETGVTIMKMDAGLDTGDILLTKKVPIGIRQQPPPVSETRSLIWEQRHSRVRFLFIFRANSTPCLNPKKGLRMLQNLKKGKVIWIGVYLLPYSSVKYEL